MSSGNASHLRRFRQGFASSQFQAESFGAGPAGTDQPLEVHLALSGTSFVAPPGRRLLDALLEQGACAMNAGEANAVHAWQRCWKANPCVTTHYDQADRIADDIARLGYDGAFEILREPLFDMPACQTGLHRSGISSSCLSPVAD